MTIETPLPSMSAADVDLSDIELWTGDRGVREAAFRALRDEPGLRFFPEAVLEGSPFEAGPGYWALARHEDVWAASRNPQLFCSGKGSNITDLPQELNEFFGSMIAMDDPKHYRLRSLVAKGFTPREVAKVEQYVGEQAVAVVDRMLDAHPGGACDFVEAIAAPLPLGIICQMMGIPDEDHLQIFQWTNIILGVGDPEYGSDYDALMNAALGMYAYAQALGEDRRSNPRDDITSTLMHAEVDGQQLTTQEFGSFFILLVVAGNETTRNAISHGMKALTDHPDQREVWFGDFGGHTRTAVEEIVRWATPVIHFRRTATADTELGGQAIAEGDKVVLWYCSANRDERVFADPFHFDVTRPVQPGQVGFGAGGPHFCLGANLARREITVMFDELRKRLPDLRITGEPEYLQSFFINGIKRLPCAWG